ncbi:hypothetical protein [Methanoregula sp.]|uniref:hypothetical protein n=1 Tax=Methanoregula sp. TaxID=2052170 RepID=UPI003C7726F2
MAPVDLSLWSTVFAAALFAVGLSFFVSIVIGSVINKLELENRMGNLSNVDTLERYNRLIVGAGIGFVLLVLVLLFGFGFSMLFSTPSTAISNTTNTSPINDTSANWALALFTLVLVVITGYYAWETHNIRREAERMREIANKPIFSFEISDSPCSADPSVSQSLYLINYGPLARDVHVTTTSDINGTLRVECKRYLIAWGTNQKIEILGDYCNIKRNEGKITTNIGYRDVNMKLYDKEKPLIIDFNENADNFLTIPYSIESRDRLAMIRVLSNWRQR